MKIIIEINEYHRLQELCWSGALQTLKEVERQGKETPLMHLLEEFFVEGATNTEVNDFIWFKAEDYLDLYPHEEEEEEEDEEE